MGKLKQQDKYVGALCSFFFISFSPFSFVSRFHQVMGAATEASLLYTSGMKYIFLFLFCFT